MTKKGRVTLRLMQLRIDGYGALRAEIEWIHVEFGGAESAFACFG
jgi:hypothetical protein